MATRALTIAALCGVAAGTAWYLLGKRMKSHSADSRGKGRIDEVALFVARDAGETLALLPVAERLTIDAGISVCILVRPHRRSFVLLKANLRERLRRTGRRLGTRPSK